MEVQSQSVALIGVPLEEGSGRRGAGMGPTALRIAGIDKALAELGHTVVDTGDLSVVPARDLPNHPKAHNLRVVGAYTRALEAATYDAAKAGHFPLILGGDHSLSMVEETTAASARLSSETENLRNLVAQFRFAQHSSVNVIHNRNDASQGAKPSYGVKAKLVRANGGASASALAYDSWEEF